METNINADNLWKQIVWVLQAEDAKRKRKEAFRAERERLNKERDMKEAMLREQMYGEDDDDVPAPVRAK